MDKKGNTKPIGLKLPYACSECNNSNMDKLMIIADAPWVIECMECGHPNDNVRYDHRADRHPRGDV